MIGRAERVASYVVLVVFAAVVFVPIVLLLLTALSPQPNGQIVLTDLRFQNFADAWQRSDFGSHLILSLVLAGTVTVVTVLIAPLAAYAIAVLKILATGRSSHCSWSAS